MIKSFCSEISTAFSSYAGELHLVSNCRQMNKLYCEIIKIWEKYVKKKKKKKKKKYYGLKSPIHGKVYAVLHLSLWVKYDEVCKVETNSVEKLSKFPLETYTNANGKDIK